MSAARSIPAPAADPIAPNGWSWSTLRGFRAGEPDAMRDVYRLYVDDVGKQLRYGFSFETRGRAHRFAGYRSAFDFHDALHETFRRAFEPRARLGYDGLRPYGPYLKAIARNVVLRTFRSREVLFPPVVDDESEGPRPLTLDDTGPTPEQSVASEQIRALVQRFLAGLDPADRRLLEIRFVEGRSQRDAADALGLGRQQLRGRETKLRQRLLEFLDARGEAGWLPAGAGLALLSMGQLVAEAWPCANTL